ncbi:MAG: hypothetical protein MHMPM18_002629 [Marteilia pararefringens]
MLVVIFAILLNLNRIFCSITCCSTTISQPGISKFSNVALQAICKACLVDYTESLQGFDYSLFILNLNSTLFQRNFVRSLISNYDSNNGLLFCTNNFDNSVAAPLIVPPGVNLQNMYEELLGFEQSLNDRAAFQISHFRNIFTLICKNLVHSAKIDHSDPLKILEDYGEIFAFRIFKQSSN